MAARDPVIVSACRTAVAREAGALKDVPPEKYGAHVVREALRRAGVAPEEVEDVILGCVMYGGGNMARLVALEAGMGVGTTGVTVDRQCGSGLQSINLAAQAVKAGEGDIYVAGGTESMTRAPWRLERPAAPYSRMPPRFVGFQLSPDSIGNPAMGITAENLALKYNISREASDRFAERSHRRAVRAQREGYFKDQVVPFPIAQRKGDPILFDTDEHPRPDTSYERLAALPPVFKKDGQVTAGNSSGVNDGAAAVVVMSEAEAARRGLEPLAYVRAWAYGGVDPNIMGIGPVEAVPKALHRAGLTLDDVEVIELNEAFACQALAVMQELKMDPERVNPNGGAVALGHPIAATGAILTNKLIYEMHRSKARYGMVTACIGGGQGIATIFERP